MTDEEMLRLASKAAGYTIASINAGAALKLATTLRLRIEHNQHGGVHGWVMAGNGRYLVSENVFNEHNRMKATCLTIVRCAAEIGKDME